MLFKACDMKDEKKKLPYKMEDLGIMCLYVF